MMVNTTRGVDGRAIKSLDRDRRVRRRLVRGMLESMRNLVAVSIKFCSSPELEGSDLI